MPDLGKMVYSKGGAAKMLYGTDGKMVYKPFIYVTLGASIVCTRTGYAQGDDTYPSNPTQDKDDMWPLALDALDAASWSIGDPNPPNDATGEAFWGWGGGTGHKWAFCRLSVDSARYATDPYAGLTLKEIAFSAAQGNSTPPTKALYVSAQTQSNDTPGSALSWITGTTSQAITSNGAQTMACDWVLSDYLFLTVWVEDHEPPDARYTYPTYAINQSIIQSQYVEGAYDTITLKLA